jgi:hypothetical protein
VDVREQKATVAGMFRSGRVIHDEAQPAITQNPPPSPNQKRQKVLQMNLGQYSHFAQVVLLLAAKDQTPPSPSEVIGWSTDGALYDKIIERAEAAGADSGAFALLTDKSTFAEQTASWANVIDPQRKLGLEWDGSGGWLMLLWSYVDLVNSNAAQIEVR